MKGTPMKTLLLMTALVLTHPAIHAESLKAASEEAAPTQAMTEAVVRKIDKDAGKITLKHGAIPNLDMPPMTMVFRVQQPAMLESADVGDAVLFHAERVNGLLTITSLQKTP